MKRTIKAMEEKYRIPSLELVQTVFTDHEDTAEGNPRNYRSRGFVTSADFGIYAHSSVGMPATECLMVKDLIPGGLAGIRDTVSYSDYSCLT